jgi:two-component system NarL family response regulator/two-component system response regulator DevR
MLNTIATTAPTLAKPVRVLVVEGQALFGKALCQVLASDSDIEVVGDADCVANAPLRRLRPDLIVLDLDGHDQEFSEAMRTCRELAPQAKVCVLSTHVQPEVMQRCLSAGADGYVVKDILPAELMRAVKSVAAGHPYVDPRVAGGVLKRRSNGFGRTSQNELSIRETEIIRLIARGMSNKEISGKLHLSEKTVKNHISRIFAKLNITARTQAAVHAIKTGLA